MNWIFSLLALISCTFLVVGDQYDVSELFRISYKNHMKKILAEFSSLEQTGLKYQGVKLCNLVGSKLSVLGTIGFHRINIVGQIKRGAFNDNEGFILILDDMSTVNIPAIVECNVKYKNDKDVALGGKAYVFYIVLYVEDEETCFDRAVLSNEMKDNKTVYMLKGAELIKNYIHTYQENRTARKFVEKWFEKNMDKEEYGKNKCEELSRIGLLNEKPGVGWNIVNGEIISYFEKKKNRKEKKKKKPVEFYLRLTNSIEIELIGVIKCEVKSKTSSSQHTKHRYLTVNYLDGKADIGSLLGPKLINGRKIFALRETIYEMLREESRSTAVVNGSKSEVKHEPTSREIVSLK